MQKARSRLAANQTNSPTPLELPEKYLNVQAPIKEKPPVKAVKAAPVHNKRLRFLPLLGLSLCFGLCTLFIFFKVRPEVIENVLLPNSYLPILVSFFLFLFFLLSYIFLNTRRAFILSAYLLVWFFFRLQRVEVTFSDFFKISLFFLAVTIIWELFKFKQSSHSVSSKHLYNLIDLLSDYHRASFSKINLTSSKKINAAKAAASFD